MLLIVCHVPAIRKTLEFHIPYLHVLDLEGKQLWFRGEDHVVAGLSLGVPSALGLGHDPSLAILPCVWPRQMKEAGVLQ